MLSGTLLQTMLTHNAIRGFIPNRIPECYQRTYSKLCYYTVLSENLFAAVLIHNAITEVTPNYITQCSQINCSKPF